MRAKVLITGITGRLGRVLLWELFNKGFEIISLSRQELNIQNLPSATYINCDITAQEKLVFEITKYSPDIIVHTAAFTNVDKCEEDKNLSFSINTQATLDLASIAKKIKATFFYISTDFVFDGAKGAPYTEEDSPNPLSVYASSKLEAELKVKNLLDKYFIIRTSRLFGTGDDFIDWLLKMTKTKKEIEVLSDKFTNPTYTKDLSDSIIKLLELQLKAQSSRLKAQSSRLKAYYGIYHITNKGYCSHYEFAKKILEYLNITDIKVIPISSDKLKRPAQRPKLSSLNCAKFEKVTKHKLRRWQKALREYLTQGKG